MILLAGFEPSLGTEALGRLGREWIDNNGGHPKRDRTVVDIIKPSYTITVLPLWGLHGADMYISMYIYIYR